MLKRLTIGALALAMAVAVMPASAQMGADSATPQPLVDAYDSLADVILAAKKTEWNLVHSILASTYSHAEGVAGKAMAKLNAGESAGAEIERLAELVAQMANEGDAAVAAVRKRLLEGGHHHNAAGEQQGIYDEGFVIVTRESKKKLLAAAGRIGKLGASPAAADLEREWGVVRKEFAALHEGTGAGM